VPLLRAERCVCAVWFLLLPWLGACAGYAETTAQARQYYYGGNYAQAVEHLDRLLGGEGRDKDRPLLLMERASAHLAAGSYELAVQDLVQADAELEVMDFTSDPAQIGRYLFSEDSGLYRGPPHEKILIPTFASIALGTMGDTQRSRTASNAAHSQLVRFGADEPQSPYFSPLSYYLLGLNAELVGDTQRAFSAYQQAASSSRSGFLDAVLLRLAEHNARRFGGHWTREYRNRAQRTRGRGAGAEKALGSNEGEIVVFVLAGRAPIRAEEKRRMSSQQHSMFLAQAMSALTRDYPQVNAYEASQQIASETLLPMSGLQMRRSRYSGAKLLLAGSPAVPCERVLPVGEHVRSWFEENRDAQITAAITRFATRVAARVGAYLAARQQYSEGVALLLGLLVGEGMRAADVPDTRCWALLPDNILVGRVRARAGDVALQIQLTGRGGNRVLTRQLSVTPGKIRFAVVVAPE
jgi:tetratricopeptide (TPR) repeat protein